MKQIVITGGKGGCGKTTVTASLAYLADNWVIADCDVDSPNLGIIARPEIHENREFLGKEFSIDATSCEHCGLCIRKCAYGAVRGDFTIDPFLCESCGFCAEICPAKAIVERETVIGNWRIADSRFGPFLDAYLQPGAENSGKLVTLLREKAIEIAEDTPTEGILIDGPPGAGCPVIASIAGAELAVAVAEPTVSGIHDVRRIIELTSTLRTPVALIINKADLSAAKTAEIKAFAESAGIPVVGELPYDKLANKAQSSMKTLAEFAPKGDFAVEMKKSWMTIRKLLGIEK
ncbi:MAG TPA: (4Fe-4S)-binding protein [candidate division Zixibacteria bacterium]|nr:(4Fe-4S)-binding protein [candidate division Zixibacteria bacterium]